MPLVVMNNYEQRRSREFSPLTDASKISATLSVNKNIFDIQMPSPYRHKQVSRPQKGRPIQMSF
jgi:hypothetical protein